MVFVDIIILVAVLGGLGVIIYFNLTKKKGRMCRKCLYNKELYKCNNIK